MAHTINSRNAGSHDPGNVNKAYEPLICRFKLSFFRSRSEIDRSRRSVPRLAIPARTTLRQTSHSHHGRHVRRRPRHHQDPGCHDRQGRQHQLHDGVAAPRQQVRFPLGVSSAGGTPGRMLVFERGFFPRHAARARSRRHDGRDPRFTPRDRPYRA